jgi:hypothetical protein
MTSRRGSSPSSAINRDFLTRQIVVEGAEKIAAAQLGQQDVSGEGAPGTPKSDILSRTAIKLTVK